MTLLLVDVDDRAAPAVLDLLGATIRSVDGSLIGQEPVGEAVGSTTVAEFRLAADAALAALRIADVVRPLAPSMRAAVWACDGQSARELELGRARDLLHEAGPGQILASGPTIARVSVALPRTVEPVDLGFRASRTTNRRVRVYELRPIRTHLEPEGRTPPGGVDTHTAMSNLGWAHRAAWRPLVGRKAHLASLEAAWQAALHGSRQTILLVGEAGIGKTALAGELALRVHARGALVLHGSWGRTGRRPYEGIEEAVRFHLQHLGPAAAPDDRLGACRDVLSQLAPQLIPEGARAPDRLGDHLRLYEAVEEWLDALALSRPVLLMLDDLPSADAAALLLLDHLAHSASTSPWMVLATANERSGGDGRPGEAERIERIELTGLTSEDIVRLVQESIGSLGPDDEAIRGLAVATAGNPLSIHCMLSTTPRPLARHAHATSRVDTTC